MTSTTSVDLLPDHLPTELVRLARRPDLVQVAPWPYRPGPPGPLRRADGVRVHGAWAAPRGDDLELVVANHGWPIEHRRCPGPMPPPVGLLDPTSSWIAQQRTLVQLADGAVAVAPIDGVLAAVASGRKPLGLADTLDGAEAEAWCATAVAEGLAVEADHQGPCPCGCGRPEIWFLSLARTERFADLLDLDAVAAWYAAALVVAGADAVIDRVTGNVLGLAGSSPADFVVRPFDLISAPFEDGSATGLQSEVVGVVLGYWPPTTAAMLSDHAARQIGSRAFPRPDLDVWDRARHLQADLAPRATRRAARDLLASLA